MACSGRYASAAEYVALLCADIDITDPAVLAQVELFLDLAASDIHAALASSGACDCTLASWAAAYLKKLNIIDAAVIQNCPCGRVFTDEQKATFIQWLEDQYNLLRNGKIEVCESATGSEYPAFGWAEVGWTDFSVEDIIRNEAQRGLP